MLPNRLHDLATTGPTLAELALFKPLLMHVLKTY